jgi:hypothetical protein
VEALKFGLSVQEFWDMTPRETIAALDAAAWRIRQEQMQMLSLAWHTAALTHARKLPPLARLLSRLQKPDKKEAPLAERRAEFEEMKKRMGALKVKGQ